MILGIGVINVSLVEQNIDFVIHAAAFSDKNELNGKYINTSKDNFIKTLNISCFSFTEISKYASEIMNGGGSLLTLSFYGSNKVMPNYNVMGVAKAALETSVKYLSVDLGNKNIRVNCVSPAFIYTDLTKNILDDEFIGTKLKDQHPMKRFGTPEEVAETICFLASDKASFITGVDLPCDGGYLIL